MTTPALTPLLAQLPASVQPLVGELLGARLLDDEPLAHFLQDHSDTLADFATLSRLTQGLVRYNLLTAYQRERVHNGDWRLLLLGNYRLLNPIGSGGMGIVYRAEHCLLKRKVALKVVPVEDDLHPAIRQRFYAEMRALAELNHPHVVAALDAGEVAARGRLGGSIYLVLELVAGGDLDAHVQRHGPCTVRQACDYIRQAAAGLHAAHDRHLIHRDVKPSNLLLSDEGQVKLVDFGLARHFASRLTDPRALLGSVEYMPPEQGVDPSSVGKEADIYGLGATLFYLLTGQPPYPPEQNVRTALVRMAEQPPRRVRDLRADVPAALDELLARLLDRDPAKRPASPLLVQHALTPFLYTEASSTELSEQPRRVVLLSCGTEVAPLLRAAGLDVQEAATIEAAVSLVRRDDYPLVVIQHLEPARACQQLRAAANAPHLKLLALTELPEIADADDVLPLEDAARLPARIDLLLRCKEAEERADVLAAENLMAAHQLRESLQARGRDVREAHNALLFAMAKMAESREGETPGHLRRLQLYCRALALSAGTLVPWNTLVDARFLELLDRCLPLHDIGKIGLPEEVLLKPGTLTPQERALIETHTLIGDRMLESLAREHGASLEFLGTARALVRHHHERHDGTGYPDRLAGDAIPAVARLTAVADVYDALRRDRVHKKAQSHTEAVKVILNRSFGQFDPVLVQAFSACHPRFEEIFQELGE